MSKEKPHKGGVIFARQTINSEIFADKPHVWFKIWFYLICKASHQDTDKFQRGEMFLYYEWICEATGATTDQLKKCMSWLRASSMIGTRRSTRGVHIKVNNYNHFQTFDNYKRTRKAPEKHQRSTREALRYNKNEKNEKNGNNNNIAETSSAEVIPDLLNDKKKHIQIIGLFALAKGLKFNSKKHQSDFIKRNVRPATMLCSYELERVKEVMRYLIKNADFKWTIETVGKYVDEDLSKLGNKNKIIII